MRYFLIFLVLIPGLAISQSKEKAEKHFCSVLTELAQKRKINGYEYDPYLIDTAFYIRNDSLYLVKRFTRDSVPVPVRYVLALNQLSSVGHDLNLILLSEDNGVRIYDRTPDGKAWVYSGNYHLLQIGMVEDGDRYAQKLKTRILKAWNDLEKQKQDGGTVLKRKAENESDE